MFYSSSSGLHTKTSQVSFRMELHSKPVDVKPGNGVAHAAMSPFKLACSPRTGPRRQASPFRRTTRMIYMTAAVISVDSPLLYTQRALLSQNSVSSSTINCCCASHQHRLSTQSHEWGKWRDCVHFQRQGVKRHAGSVRPAPKNERGRVCAPLAGAERRRRRRWRGTTGGSCCCCTRSWRRRFREYSAHQHQHQHAAEPLQRDPYDRGHGGYEPPTTMRVRFVIFLVCTPWTHIRLFSMYRGGCF